MMNLIGSAFRKCLSPFIAIVSNDGDMSVSTSGIEDMSW